MSEKCFIFPGQGSQKAGMGKEFYEKNENARRIWKKAEEILGTELKRTVFEGPEEKLKQTAVTQPAVYVTEIVILNALIEAGIKPSAAAGHSLGEYAAAAASGAVNWQTGLELVRERARIFEKESALKPGGMIAAIGIDARELSELLATFNGTAEIVNYNCPGQLVLSADKNILADVLKAVSEKAKMAVELEVSGAFHSSLMNDAALEMKEVIMSADISDPQIPFYVNCTGTRADNAQQVSQALSRQVNSPVRWIDTIENIKKDFPEAVFFEAGPGNVLKGLLRRIDRGLQVKSVSEPQDIEREIQS